MGQAVYGLLRATSRYSQPWQVAGAVVAGCCLGLMPKLNLLFPIAFITLTLLPIHLVVAAICLIFCSLLGPAVTPASGVTGEWLLSRDAVQSLVFGLENYPLIAWLGLHNTSMAGWIGLVTIGIPPLYLIVHHRILYLRLIWLRQQIELITDRRDVYEFEETPNSSETAIILSHTATVERPNRKVTAPALPVKSLSKSESMVVNHPAIQPHPAESPLFPKLPVVVSENGVQKSDVDSGLTATTGGLVRRDESLRHLLNHLRTVKEKV